MTNTGYGKSMGRWLLYLSAAGVVGLGLWYYLGNETAAEVSFEQVSIDKGTIEQSVSATGAVQATTTVDLSSQLSGQVADVKVDYNSKVQKGDLLATIDKKTYATRVKSAEANLAMAQANIQVQEAIIEKNRALVKKAEQDLDRQKKLSDKGVSSQTSLESNETALATAKADLQVALAQLENVNALVAQRKSDLQAAQIDLERTDLRSPIDGVVIARNIDPGGTVAVSLSAPVLFKIAQDLSKIQIETQVDEADIGRIKEGNDVTFTVDAFPDETFRGQVEQVRIGGTAETNVVTYTVIVRARNPREKLLPGMTATVRIVTGRKENVLRVANGAVRFRPPKSFPGAEDTPRWGRREAFLAEMTELLKLTDEQQTKLNSSLEELRARRINAQGIEQNGGNEDGQARRTRGRRSGGQANQENGERRRGGAFYKVLAGILTEDQLAVLKKWRDERRETTRPAVVWLHNGEKLVPRRIRLGLADEAYSEVASGALNAGDKVVTRISTEQKNGRRRRRQ